MDTNHHAHLTPQFRVLSDYQIELIIQGTLECLNRTGVKINNFQARQLLEKAGARVEADRVHIPHNLVQEAIASNPRSFTLWGRDSKHQLLIAPNIVYFGPGPTCTYFIDPATGERRKTHRGDPELTAKVADALDNIDFVMSLGLIDDVTPHLAPVYEFAEMLTNTGKPVLPWAYSPENLSDIYQMALAVAGSEETLRQRPFLAFFSTYQSPLVQTEEDLANVLWAVEHDLPVVYIGGGTAGTDAPITGAGALVISLAGALCGLTIMQLSKPGARVCIGSVPGAMDLRTGQPPYGAPEMSLYSAALSDICKYLGLPFMGTAGASEAKIIDLQSAIESSIQVVLSGLSGATLVHDVGFLDCAQIGSLESLVMNDEIIAMTRRILRGIEVNDDTLMLDLIDKVGPGGSFLSTPETAKRCRSEIWNPSLMDRQSYSNWLSEGAKTMNVRIREKLKNILDTHQPPPLPEGAAEKIELILQAAERREAIKSNS